MTSFLIKKRDWASELKLTLNKADASRNARQEEIVYRNKIILLGRKAQANINTWLDPVYFDDPKKRANYASDYFRRVRNKTANRINPEDI
ncbi:hypothetical protein CHISP_1202 [Chitinispirillum alkaliphilum]|nr:hypothetical protein CHISP_1202 [Chitinispirillum alkaliphilum]